MEQYIEAIKLGMPGQCIILDEGNLFLLSRDAMSSQNKDALRLFALMRQKRLITIICVPNFFTLDTYVREHRVDTLFHIFRQSKTMARYICVTRPDALRQISKDGRVNKQVMGHDLPDGSYFLGRAMPRFPKLNDIDETFYKVKKADHFNQFLDDLKHKLNKESGASKDSRRIRRNFKVKHSEGVFGGPVLQ